MRKLLVKFLADGVEEDPEVLHKKVMHHLGDQDPRFKGLFDKECLVDINFYPWPETCFHFIKETLADKSKLEEDIADQKLV